MVDLLEKDGLKSQMEDFEKLAVKLSSHLKSNHSLRLMPFQRIVSAVSESGNRSL